MDNLAYVIYGVLLLFLVGGSFFRRGEMAKNVNYLLIWAGIILVLVIGYDLYDKNRSAPREIDNGSYVATIQFDPYAGGYQIDFEANGAGLHGVIDTGATAMILTYEDARSAGIDVDSLSFSHEFDTANGSTYAAATRLNSLNFGPVVYDDVNVYVSQAGDLDTNLIGMSIVRRFKAIHANGDNMFIEF